MLYAKFIIYLDRAKHKNSSSLSFFFLNVRTITELRNTFSSRNSFLDCLSFFSYFLPLDILIFPYDLTWCKSMVPKSAYPVPISFINAMQYVQHPNKNHHLNVFMTLDALANDITICIFNPDRSLGTILDSFFSIIHPWLPSGAQVTLPVTSSFIRYVSFHSMAKHKLLSLSWMTEFSFVRTVILISY